MGTTFPKDIMDCMKGCILSIFWPKKDIVDFMKKVGCTSRELMPESEYKELHRAEIVDKIFTNLEKRSDSGIGQFRCMLKELTEWNYFDPYYFQKLNKLSESEAKRNISHLKQLQEIRDYKIKQERQRQEEQERKRKDISISINELKEIFLNLFSGKDQNGKEINVQRRGYLFEEFLKKLFLNEGIEVTEPFKIVGEQIDGSIKYDGEHYIIETFQCFLITGIVMIGVWWCTNKEWAGYISAIILITIDRSFESHGLIFGSYQVSSYTYKVGLNLGVNIIYPLIVMVIIFVLVNVAVRFKKKEFLGT